MGTFLLRNARILDTDAGCLRDSEDVLVEEHEIVDVGGSVRPPKSAVCLDLRGRVLMPGLIDAHVHVMAAVNDHGRLASMPPYLVAAHAKAALEDMLRRGFTTVRDAGGAEAGLREAVDLDLFVGPRLFVCGLALAQTGGLGDFRGRVENPQGCPTCRSTRTISRVADGVEGVRLAVREELHAGADHIKVMASGGNAGVQPIETSHYTSEELAVMVEEARAFGTYVMAHAYGSESIRRAVDAGIRTIEHGNLIDRQTAGAIADRAYMVPTLATYEAGIKHADELGTTPATAAQIQSVLDAGIDSLRMCREESLALGFGTDLEGPLQRYQLREFALRARAESPAEILRSATVVNAEILGHGGRLGMIAPGALADVLVIDGNPLDTLAVFREDGANIRLLMKAGKIYKNDLEPDGP